MINNGKDDLSISNLRRSALQDPVLMRQLRRILSESSHIPVGSMNDRQLFEVLEHWVEAGRFDLHLFSELVPSLTAPTLAGAVVVLNQETDADTLAAGEDEEEVLEPTALAQLRIVLLDKEEKPLKDQEWELVSPVRKSDKTGTNGLIEIKGLPLISASGLLKVTMKTAASEPPVTGPATAPPAVGGASSDPPPYPPPIKAVDFKDKDKKLPDDVEGEEGKVEWTLSLRLPKEMVGDAGIKERLHNLGFSCDTKSDAVATTKAVKAYQKGHMKNKNPSGQLTEIKSDVEKWHDTI